MLDEPKPGMAYSMGPGIRHKGLVVTLICILLLFVVLLVGIALIPSSVWRRLIIYEVGKTTGREVAIDGDVHVHLLRLHPELTMDGFRLANAAWAPTKDMLTMQHFDVTLSLLPLLRGHVIFPKIAIDSPTLDLERQSVAKANWTFSSAAPAKPASSDKPLHLPVIQQLIVTNGKVIANDRVAKLKFDGRIAINEERDSPSTSGLTVRGNGSLNDKPFDLQVKGGSLINIDPGTPYAFDAQVSAADIKLHAHTTFAHPFDFAAVQSTFDVSGKDLADVYYLTGLALPNTPPYDISGTINRDNMTLKIDDFHGKLGGSDIAGKLNIDTAGKRPKITAELMSKVLNLADLAAPLGTQAGADRKADTIAQPTVSHATTPATASGKSAAAAAPAAADPNASQYLLPDADLQVARVRGMDADVTYDAASVVTPKLPMKKVHFHLVLDDGKLSLDPLAFTLPQGQVAGSVNINARGATPVTDLDMRLINIDLSQFKSASSATPPIEGQLLGRIKLHGTGSSVHKTAADAEGDITFVIPNGQMREVFAELTGIAISKSVRLLLAKDDKDTELRCGVTNFHATNGDLVANALLIDTTHVLITGSGHVDLKTEGIDMSIRGQPKEVRLLRLRTPITLHGTLLHPTVGVEASKLAEQAGGAVALGVLLTPIASVLAFVDKGLAKDANCAALTTQLEQSKDVQPSKQ